MKYKEIIETISKDSIKSKQEFFENVKNIEIIDQTVKLIVDCYNNGGKLIVFGNGGSAADSQHVAAEFIVRFEKEGKALPCIALTTDSSVLTAAANDYDFSKVFSRQIEAIAKKEDVLLAISTSGNSENIIEAVKEGKNKGASVVALTGNNGGKLVGKADISIVVENNNTARIQEIHVTIIHILCKIIEDAVR